MKTTKWLSLLLVLALILSAALTGCAVKAPESAPVSPEAAPASGDFSYTAKAEDISEYGNVQLSVTCTDFLALGFAFGDVVTVSFLDESLQLPVCSNYSDVDSGTAGLFARDADEYVSLAINMGDFASAYGIAERAADSDTWNYCEGVTGPVSFSISLHEPCGYYGEYVLHQLSYTNERADYPDLTDEQFANFRSVSTTGMGESRLYRTASPINPENNRNTYADAALRASGVTVVLNLADTDEEIPLYEGFDESCYSSTKHMGLSMSVNFASDDFKEKLASGLRFMASNPGTYAVHCTEGKDRAGFVCALLECIMGASAEEVVADYMVSFYNYYGVKPGDAKYYTIANSNIVETLQNAFGTYNLYSADLSAYAAAYLKGIGMTDAEIAALKANLA